MGRKPIRLGLFAVALSISAGATAQNGGPLAVNVSPQNKASVQSNALSQTEAPPTAAQLDQSAAVVMPPPILRNTGRTVVVPDQPLLGRLSLQTLHGLVREEPPPLQPAPNEAAVSSGMGNASATGQVHD